MVIKLSNADAPLNREPPLRELISSFLTLRNGYDRNHGPTPHVDGTTHRVVVDGPLVSGGGGAATTTTTTTPAPAAQGHSDGNSYNSNEDSNSNGGSLELSVAELRAMPRQHEVVCALQCAGNRRHTMRTLLREVDGLDWGDGAVMNCRWRGPRLRDVLLRAGVRRPSSSSSSSDDDAAADGEEDVEENEKRAGGRRSRSRDDGGAERRADGGADADEGADADGAARWRGHVQFACFQVECEDTPWYGASIELERAMSEEAEVILALEMNGEPLTVEHGAPVRVIAPGIAGARSVKWLDRITVQRHESTNHYQTRDYKILPPEATDRAAAARFWDTVPAIQDMPINSVVGSPRSEARDGDGDAGAVFALSPGGTLEVRGYALPQGADGPVVRVEVSADDGATWTDAELAPTGEYVGHGDGGGGGGGGGGGTRRPGGRWCWVLWRCEVRVEPGEGRRIVSRATDWAGNVQQERSQWNLRGVAYSGYGEARNLTIKAS